MRRRVTIPQTPDPKAVMTTNLRRFPVTKGLGAEARKGLAIYHVVLIGIVVTIGVLWWGTVRAAPWTLSMILPRTLAFTVGSMLFILAAFGAFGSAWVVGSPTGVLRSIVTGFAGLWLVLATSSSLRGSYEDNRMMVRLVAMLVLLLTTIIAMLYIRDRIVVSVMQIALVAAGLGITRSYLKDTP